VNRDEVIGGWFACRAGLGAATITDQDPPAPAGGHHLTSHVVTSDAVGDVLPIQDKRAHFIMIVKQNRQRLFDVLNGLAWKDVKIGHQVQESGHGRR
jgi:hypothetical protein